MSSDPRVHTYRRLWARVGHHSVRARSVVLCSDVTRELTPEPSIGASGSTAPWVLVWQPCTVRTRLCELVGTDIPIVQAGMSIYTSPALCAAVSNAGALGSLGVWQRPVEQLRADLALLRELTNRPFALNHVVPDLNEDAFELTLQAAPTVIACALDDPGPRIEVR